MLTFVSRIAVVFQFEWTEERWTLGFKVVID